MHEKRCREVLAERRHSRSQALPLPLDEVGEEPKVVAPQRLRRSYTTAVFAASTLAQAINALPSSSMTTLPDRPQKCVKTVTEAIQASNRSAIVTNRRFI
jgi:hypothetical protein